MTSGRRPTLAQCALFIFCLLLVLGAVDAALAQPFGITRGSAPSPFGGFGPFSDFTGWMFAKQAEFYRMLSGSIRAAKADGTRGLGPDGHFVRLWHFPRRRPRSRQGGDLVLSGRQ